MPARFLLKVVSDFAAAHSLRGYPGDCRKLHGHNWKVEVEMSANALDELGMGIDFKVVKNETKAVTDELDHSYLNEQPPFDTVNPTAENIAAHIYRRLGERMNDERVQVHSVTVWETERACVRYTEEP